MNGPDSLWDRLRKRKLVQWAIAYLAGAWLLLQALDLFAQPFAWPDLVIRAATVVLGVGFVAALVLAWYHGERGAQRVTGIELLMLTALLVIAGAALTFVGGRLQGGTNPARPVADMEAGSIAVLPFVNMSADPENEYFSDGITEELLNALAHVEGLRVAARTSSFAFKGSATDVREVGHKLSVSHVLEGSVRKAGDRLRITAQLVKVADGYHVWSQSYDRELKDIFAVQDEISRAIVDALRVRLVGVDATPLVRGQTQNLDAYELYLKGRFFWNKRTAEGLERAAEYFEQALASDPNYAPAYAGLADTYALFSVYDVASSKVSVPKARAAALKALELDPGLAEAHAALGYMKTVYDWDWEGAEAEFRRALELKPSLATAYQWSRLLYLARGRFDEALAQVRRAQELDPLSLIINMTVGTPLYYGRRYDEAIQQYRATIELDPSFPRVHSELGDAYLQTGRIQEAIAEHRKAVELSAGAPQYLGRLGRAYAVAGRRRDAAEILDALKELTDKYAAAYLIAHIHAALGENDATFQWLDKAVENHDYWLIYVKVDPALDPIRSDPRYARLLKRLNL